MLSGTGPTGSRPRMAADPVIFGVSAALVSAVLAFSLAAPELAKELFLGLQDWIVENLGWLFVGTVTFLLLFAGWLAISPYGAIRLGRDDEEPDFPRLTWLAMLFSAGMGIGLLFYGVAEPVLHYAAPPDGAGGTPAAARDAMRLSLFHWGLHAWGIYAVIGLALAYVHHRRGRPLAVRFTLEPLLKEWTDRTPGKLIDVVAVFGTLFGLATSLGLGAAQINAGLDRVFGLPSSVGTQVVLIAVITGCATISVVTGLGTGIRRLSELNMVLAASLLAFVLLAGPTAFLLRALPDQVGYYLGTLPALSLRTHPFGDFEWQKAWTIFYWAWWISWAPFVGTFVARISKGRTVREFIAGTLLVPTAAAAVWFGVFGGTALHDEVFGTGGIAAAVSTDVSTAIYVLLERLPGGAMTSVLAVVVVALFFVTSSDSGSFVVDMLTSGGNPDPPVWQRVFWAVTEGALASVLLLAGGLRALQSAAINTGLLFCLVLLGASVSLLALLRRDPASRGHPERLPADAAGKARTGRPPTS